jgi:hypothetical protein
MFKSKTFYFIRFVILLACVVYLVYEIATDWNRLMQQDRFRLFMRITILIISTGYTIDYFLQWKSWGKPKLEKELY